jgi:hypothetical protein
LLYITDAEHGQFGPIVRSGEQCRMPALMVGSIGRAALHDLLLSPTGKCRLFLKGAAVADSASRSG